MTRALLCTVCVAMALAGCGESRGRHDSRDPDVLPPDDGVVGVPSTGDGVDTGTAAPSEPTTRPVTPPIGVTPVGPFPTAPSIPIPTDEREVVTRDVPPPPISGGTLIIARDGRTAIAADPDRDRVVFVDLVNDEVLGQVTLDSGSEPGRLAEDANGRVHVALRGSGKLASIDIATRTLLDEQSVCGSPRGVAYDGATDALHVACLQGELVTVAAGDGAEQRRVALHTDLRDVLVTKTGLRVTQFKSARVLELDQAGEEVGARDLHTVSQLHFDQFDGSEDMRSFEPTLARRAVAFGADSTLVLHERAMVDTIELDDPHAMTSEDGTAVPLPIDSFGGGESAYGSAGGCTSIVQTAVSVVDGDGTVRQTFSLAGATLPMDVAVSPDGRFAAVADAGRHELDAPTRSSFGVMGPIGFPGGVALSGGGLTMFSLVDGTSLTDSDDMGQNCTFGSGEIPIEGQPTAVAFTPDGSLVVQSREPALLNVVSSLGTRRIALGGGSRYDTGHEIFHRDAGASIACASCHGEAGDDGHVWNFSTLGPRRTQSLMVGIEGTEPFHWSGDMKDLPMLVSEVLVERMGGVNQSSARVDALGGWLFEQTAPKSLRASDEPAVLRGKKLFESNEVGCTSCHEGSKLTNNKTVDVGTGEALQVPSLVGIAYRAPFIHTGCAKTLAERFDPACGGGDRHGRTSQLDGDQIDDLVAYLESL